LEEHETHRQMCEAAFPRNDRRHRARVRPMVPASPLRCVRDDDHLVAKPSAESLAPNLNCQPLIHHPELPFNIVVDDGT
jgi:hypothetical protein